MAWLVPENMLDDQQRDFVENIDLIKEMSGSRDSLVLENLYC
jgi:hypothetical protein